MSKAQVLTSLQMLLNRVRTRAAEPRVRDGAAVAETSSAVSAPEAAPVAVATPVAVAAQEIATAPAPQVAASAPAEEAEVSIGMSTWTPPPGGDNGFDVEVDVDIDMAESVPPPGAVERVTATPAASLVAAPAEPPARTESESEERLVAAQPVSPEATQEAFPASDAERTPSAPLLDVAPAAAQSPGLEPAAPSGVALASAGVSAVAPAGTAPLEALPHDSWTPPSAASPQPAPQTVPELEPDRASGSPVGADDTSTALEPAPASSRRPVEPEEEQLADMAFGPSAPQPPRHTPPPESGRLPAAPPDEFDDVDVTGVRDATALANTDLAEPVAARVELRADPIVPEATRPTLTSVGDVADVVGPAPKFLPKTFAELLEATLSL